MLVLLGSPKLCPRSGSNLSPPMHLSPAFVFEKIAVAVESIDLVPAKMKRILLHVLPLDKSFYLLFWIGSNNQDAWTSEAFGVHSDVFWVPNIEIPMLTVDQIVRLEHALFLHVGWR